MTLAIHILANEQTHPPAPGHPENVSRLQLASAELSRGLAEGKFSPLTVEPHDMTAIARIHDQSYLDLLKRSCEAGGGYLDADTYIAPRSLEAIHAMIDAGLSAVDQAIEGERPRSFILGRPPGHHAEHDRAMGFCLVNNIAIVAQYAVDRYKLKRIAIVDFDVHHGNGTQHLFYDRSDVFFISMHQFPFYPGTGSAGETGIGSGRGYTLNIPLAPRSDDTAVFDALEHEIVPALRHYRPQLLLVSAGFDGHRLDPLGGLMFTGEAFERIGRILRQSAEEFCGGKVISLLEGGYNPEGNKEAITRYIDGLENYE